MAGVEVMSMWTRMPGQSWPGAAASFVGLWMVMMVPMMLPSLLPVLWRSHLTIRHAVVAGVGYYAVWGAVGVVAYPVGVAARLVVMADPMLERVAVGVVVVIAGAYQLSRWKAYHLERCRLVPSLSDVRAAWRQGVRLGLHCNYCSLGFTAILMVTGLMDVRAMVLVSALTGIERLAHFRRPLTSLVYSATPCPAPRFCRPSRASSRRGAFRRPAPR
ncbi:MAG: hypothetical protein JWL61_813 [Gemmatimonadetes bacterium]|nr:hypothetical protein [Gemmatimonadota bacterium]